MPYESGPAIDNLDPRLREIALRIVAESGGRVTISSGWRSNAHQTQLYNDWLAGRHPAPVVAKPGTSRHEHGGAVDFGGDLRLAQQLGAKYGLIFPVEGEAWHAQLGDNFPTMDSDGQPMSGVQYDLNYTGAENEVDPSEVLANRLHSVNRILGLNPVDGSNFFMVASPTGMDPLAEQNMATPGMPNPVMPEAGPRYDAAQGQFEDGQVDIIQDVPDDNPENVVYGKGNKADYQRYAYSRLAEFGFKPEDMPALITLWNKESGWNPLAQNPTSTAFGIAQFLNGTWEGTGVSKTPDPHRQIDAGLMYIKARYGNPRNALNFHLANNWY